MRLPEMKIGDLVDFEQEGILGVIVNIFENEHGEQASIVLELANKEFATIDLSKIDYANKVIRQ